jgi:hypothetical protein
MRFLMQVLWTLCLSWSPAVFAGGMTGGGGELLQDAVNPWFVQAASTAGPGAHEATHKVVRYCVEADEDAFGLPMEDLETQVQRAFDYWWDEFSSAELPSNGPGATKVLVAMEKFGEQACDGTEQLRFQFGTLSEPQLASFAAVGQDPTKFVAVAIRTDYDEINLQGKGFIYVSPPKGKLAMAGRDIASDAWQRQNQAPLAGVLAHELGHMFGLQHSGAYNELMGAGFPEYLVNKNTNYFGSTSGIFKIPQGVDLNTQAITPFAAEFFGAPAAAKLISIRILPGRLQVATTSDEILRPTIIGEATLTDSLVDRLQPLVRLWLPDGQTLFPNIPSQFGKILTGPTARQTEATGIYVNAATGEKRNVHVHMSPDKVQVGGIWNGQIVMDIFNHTSQESTK